MDDKTKKALARLEEMGLKPGVMQTPGKLDILMEGPDGKSFSIPFDYDDTTYDSLPAITPVATVVPNDLRGKNVATEAYKAAEQISGRKIVPDDTQTASGFALHTKRGLGKDFGMSEDELESLLSPEDKAYRGRRKQAVLNAIEKFKEQATLPPTPDDEINPLAKARKLAIKERNALLSPTERTNTSTVLETLIDDAIKSGDPVKYATDNTKKFLSRVKSVAGPAVGLGSALMAGSAADALAEVVPGGVENVGEGSDKALLDSQARDVELTRDISKDDDTLTQTRLKALQRMLGK